jgi:uncharacterized protein (TIGR03437 family)
MHGAELRLMNRIVKIALLASFPAVLAAQPVQQSSIIIGAPTTPWFKFYVDGQLYQGTATFVWPKGSKHTVQALSNLPLGVTCPAVLLSQLNTDSSMEVLFSGWKDNTGLLIPGTDPIQTVTADPTITSLEATIQLSYRVTLNYYNGQLDASGNVLYCLATGGAPGPAPKDLRPGVVYIDGVSYWNSAIIYVPAGNHTLNAFPYPGFVFDGWSMNGGPPSAYLSVVDIEAPVTLYPRFEPAKRVRFITSPSSGMNVLVDHTTIPTAPYYNDDGSCPSQFTRPPSPPPTVVASIPAVAPLCLGEMEFVPGSQHVIGSALWETDIKGKVWVFTAFNKGGQGMVYTADANSATLDTVTSNYVPGAVVSLRTTPFGLPLTVDGRASWPSYDFVWGQDSVHTVSAVPTVTDSKGRKYTFRSWSNGGPATQNITMDPIYVTGPTLYLTATYDGLSRIVVQTSPPGLVVQVDGSDCQSPCTVDRSIGTQVHVTAPSSVPIGDGSRLDFSSWSDNASADHLVTVASDTVLTANYQNMYRLDAGSTPAGGASFQFAPTAPDMYYPATAVVTVNAKANPGFKFRRWTGDLSGTYPSGSVAIMQPASVTAQLDTVPYIKPTGVQNAAGATPDQVVAPGSIIAISGASLATDTFKGPANPLVQTLGGVVVTVGQQYLPLTLVSPAQVNAQLPADLPEGSYTLTLSASGQPDVSAPFTVARNAPGLYTNPAYTTPVASAFHQDLTPITPDSPAIQGEIVTVYGTGFGPTQNPSVTGFLIPDAPPNPLVDTLQIQLGDFQPAPVWSGASADVIGMQVTRFQITPDLPAATTLELKVTVNGRTSNTVLLPLQ